MRSLPILSILVLLISFNSHAINLVRDAEIEDYLYEISSPIFQAGGTPKESIQFYLVKDNAINAFVYGGQNIFVNTGLIESSNTPNMLQGVIAHEFGHIIGAHLIKSQPSMQKAIATYAISTLIGVGILATSQSNSGTNAAIASTLLGQQIAERQYLTFSRMQESEADRYAMLFMKKSDISSDGMLELFKKLESVQSKYTKDIDKYSITHPLTTDRISYFKNHPSIGLKTSEEITQKHFFIQAKILAHSGNATLQTNSHTILMHHEYKAYYLAYQNLLENKYQTALLHMNYLIKLHPNNPYFHESLAIIYTKMANYKVAQNHFQKAIDISDSDLIRQEYAAFLITNFENPSAINDGIDILNELKNTKENGEIIYQNLQYAYSKLKMQDYYLISRIEEIALFTDKKNIERRDILPRIIAELKSMMQKNPNNVVIERLKRIESIL